MSATPSTPSHTTTQSYVEVNLSPISLSPIEGALLLMAADKILQAEFFSSLPEAEQDDMHRCILFLYGFMGTGYRSWGEIVPSANAAALDEFQVLHSPSAEDRIALVRAMTTTDRGCRKRLLQVATTGGDRDLTVDGKSNDFIKNYLRCLLRFFSMEGSFGFQEDMTDVAFSLCLQSRKSCFLIAACEMVDLQTNMDLPHPTGKKLCLDKSQVARRTMSSVDLFRYVIHDKGDSALEVLLKLLGGGQDDENKLANIFRSSEWESDEAAAIDFHFPRYLKIHGPGLLSFAVHENLKTAACSGESEIPCFDGAFDSKPVANLSLACLAQDEAIKIQEHLPQSGKSETTSGHVSDNAASLVPNRQESEVSSSSETFSFLDVEFGDKEDAAPVSWMTYLTGVAWSTFVRVLGGKDQGEGSLVTSACWTSLDNVAATPGTSDNGQDHHAVVLLGGYTDTDGKNWYLMQNSWRSMPLFLASAEYLGACSVNAVFIKNRMKTHCTTKRFTECASAVATCKTLFGAARVATPNRRKDDGFICGVGLP
jgi:hypothetical protein